MKDACLFLIQSKTKKKLRVSLSTELQALISRIRARKRTYKIYSTHLIVNEKGRALSVGAMSRRWRKACLAVGIEELQFRDLRAKAGTDKAELAGDVRQAQKQLGHESIVMTEHYIRNRKGTKVTPTR